MAPIREIVHSQRCYCRMNSDATISRGGASLRARRGIRTHQHAKTCSSFRPGPEGAAWRTSLRNERQERGPTSSHRHAEPRAIALVSKHPRAKRTARRAESYCLPRCHRCGSSAAERYARGCFAESILSAAEGLRVTSDGVLPVRPEERRQQEHRRDQEDDPDAEKSEHSQESGPCARDEPDQ